MHRRLLQLARTSHFGLSITIASGVLTGALALGQAYLISTIVNNVFLQKETLVQVWIWMRMLLGVIAARGLLIYINEVAANTVAVHVKTDVREQLIGHILTLGPSYTRGERTGELTNAAVEGIEALDAYFSQYIPQLVISILVPISILIVVFPLDPLSGVILLVTAPLIPFFMNLIGRAGEGITQRQYDTLVKMSAYFLDSLQGLTTLKLFGQSKAQIRNIARISDQYRDATLRVLQVTFLSAFALELIATLSTAIIAVEVGLRLLYSQMQFREALFLLILAPEFYLPLRMLGIRFHAGMAGTTAARRIFQILDTRKLNASPLETGFDSQCSTKPVQISNIELANLSYTYPGETHPALEDVSLTISRGQHVALVGASGSGKTTLAGILLRFMEPTSGQITVDHAPLSDISPEDWRGQIAWVPQIPYLFHDTLAVNIRLGKPAASIQEIKSAARLAYLEEFVEALPEKYETVIGEGGARLSSGQAQRLALARAFLRDASILILDEPTSSLDPELESLLEDSTRRLMRDRTVITIAHRLNTIFHADKIFVLKAGHIVEKGTHRDLLAQKGEYARMVHAGKQVFISDGRQLCSEVSTSSQVLPVSPLPDFQTPSINSKSSIFFRLLKFLSGSWGWVVLSVLLSSLTIGSNMALMATSAWLISTAALHPSIAVLEVSIVGVRVFGISRAVFRYLERLVSHSATLRLLGRVRLWFYTQLEPLAPARLIDYHAGDLLARIIGDVATLQSFYVRIVAPPLTAFLVAIGASLYLFSIDPRLALLLIAFFILLGAILPTIAQALGHRSGIQAIICQSDLHTQLVDDIQGLPELLAFGRGRDRLEQLTAASRKYGDVQNAMAQINGFHSGVGAFLTNFALWLALVLGIPLCTFGRIDAVMLAPLALFTLSAFEAVTPLPLAAQMWSNTRTAAKRLFDLVDSKSLFSSPMDGENSSVDSRCVSERQVSNRQPFRFQTPPHLKNASLPPSIEISSFPSHFFSIEFSNLSFAYPNQTTPALQNVSFDLKSGNSLAIVGPSGAGKSTLANLLLKFWDYSSGDIRLGGRSLKSCSPDEVRSWIACIPPNPYFFNTSIYENLRMARRNVSRAEIEQAARDSQIHRFITDLPQGYETLVGERGLRLSGGERQRLAITRALIKNTPILILDEPTANLDQATEARILETLFDLIRRKTSLLITHRLVGLEHIANILVMDHGSIVERGSQAELLESHGLFRRLWDLQNQYLVASG